MKQKEYSLQPLGVFKNFSQHHFQFGIVLPLDQLGVVEAGELRLVLDILKPLFVKSKAVLLSSNIFDSHGRCNLGLALGFLRAVV